MAPVFCLTAREARIMLPRMAISTPRNTGTITATTRASCHWMVNMTISAPTMVTAEMNRSSGPWWASSVISKRSLVKRLISWPVRFWSK